MEQYYVRGIDRDGDELFYTGRAGAGFAHWDRAKAFLYDSKQAAQTRAKNLNLGMELHGIRFIALLY